MAYRVEQYPPDGCFFPDRDRGTFPTLRAARAYIRERIGGRCLGRWWHETGEGQAPNECWHASYRRGCGGYEIIPES